ncbi:Xanthine/uracil permease [Lentinus tigrinus ALCF2SS1-6]|uniref:Xanthine/uracil permease n=1 Tax=Lentinus tigrinus ALCF2SS1-6 TaxID=1328759 RepID=A0A5C2SHP8_9APHY|nr:Xanthine/uracil permease [Lentinus tigrinus ALCF2SS1-6]
MGDSQPKATLSPELTPSKHGFHAQAAFFKHKLTTRHGWLGDYDYAWLCLPSLPFFKRSKGPPPFYALDAELPLVLAIFTGFQHALAMLAGLITPPIIFASALSLDDATSAYMISASLIGCGILSLVQLSRLPLFGGYYLGTGLISVVGTSFSTLSTANAIFDAMYRDGTCSFTTAADGSVTRDPCPDAYGKVLGTSLICSLLEIGLAFVPPRVLKRFFPPMVTGIVILLIGASLVGSSGALDWGGGSNGCQNFPTSGILQLCPTTLAPRPLPWGSPEFIGLGFLSFISIILTERFGSPFLKNISIIVGLAVGCIVAGAAGYIDGSSIKTAPTITFLWVYTFKIGVYPPAILPMLAVYVSLAMEATGDITASAEVSRLPVDGTDFDSRIQGGILSDGLGGFISALFTVAPLSIFAQVPFSFIVHGCTIACTCAPQNNGVIAITRCANRSAGRWCCAFLILFGILGKISGFFLAIPKPVLGGVTTFLFATVAVSGLRVISFAQFTRRDRFVLAASLSFGLADILVPGIFTHLFDGVDNPSSGLQGLFNSITIILSTPFLAAGIVASVLNIILTQEAEENEVDGDGSLEEEGSRQSEGKVEV